MQRKPLKRRGLDKKAAAKKRAHDRTEAMVTRRRRSP